MDKAELDHLKLLDASKSRILAEIVHDLQGPITPLEGYLELLLAGQLGNFDESFLPIFKSMRACLLRLAFQIQQVQLLSRLKLGSLLREEECFSLWELLNSILHEHQEFFVAKNSQVHLENNLQPANVIFDLRQAHFVISALLFSCLHQMHPDSSCNISLNKTTFGRLSAKSEQKIQKNQVFMGFFAQGLPLEKPYLEFIIQYHGLPLNVAEFKSLDQDWEFFGRNKDTAAFADINLELFLMLQILKAHDSCLYLESHERIGSLISCVFPLMTDS